MNAFTLPFWLQLVICSHGSVTTPMPGPFRSEPYSLVSFKSLPLMVQWYIYGEDDDCDYGDLNANGLIKNETLVWYIVRWTESLVDGTIQLGTWRGNLDSKFGLLWNAFYVPFLVATGCFQPWWFRDLATITNQLRPLFFNGGRVATTGKEIAIPWGVVESSFTRWLNFVLLVSLNSLAATSLCNYPAPVVFSR